MNGDKLTAEQREWVQRTLDSAPPMSPETAARLVRWLAGAS